jgi:hypothetical protein
MRATTNRRLVKLLLLRDLSPAAGYFGQTKPTRAKRHRHDDAHVPLNIAAAACEVAPGGEFHVIASFEFQRDRPCPMPISSAVPSATANRS